MWQRDSTAISRTHPMKTRTSLPHLPGVTWNGAVLYVKSTRDDKYAPTRRGGTPYSVCDQNALREVVKATKTSVQYDKTVDYD